MLIITVSFSKESASCSKGKNFTGAYICIALSHTWLTKNLIMS